MESATGDALPVVSRQSHRDCLGKGMAKLVKIVLITALVLLVVFAAIAHTPMAVGWFDGFDLSLYLSLSALLGLVIAAFRAWGYKLGVEASQKFKRAKEVLAQADLAAERKQSSMEQMEQRLMAEYAQKEKALNETLDQAQADYQSRLSALKEQNIKLKETVTNLMQEIKKKKQI
jgi:gas vesicle protein